MTISQMLHVFHPPHQYIITSQITWDFGSSFSNSFFYSHLFGYSPLSMSHLFYSLLPCACHQEKQAELGRKLEELKLKNLYWKKKKNLCGKRVQPCPSWALCPNCVQHKCGYHLVAPVPPRQKVKMPWHWY